MLYSILYVLSLLAFALSHSLPSKCWHISFKWSVFISHSLFPSYLISLFILWGEAECVLEGSIPRQPHSCFSSSYLFPLSFLSPPSVSSDFYCQRLDVSTHLSKTSFLRQLFDCQTVAYYWFLWKSFIAKSAFFFFFTYEIILIAGFIVYLMTMRFVLNGRLNIRRAL